MLKELNQVVVRLGCIGSRKLLLVVAALCHSYNRRLSTILIDCCLDLFGRLEILHLLFVALYDLLEEVGPLCQLLLDIHVDFDVLLQLLDFLFVVVILGQQRFRLLGLELKFLRQLAILHDCQPRRRLLLLIVQCAQVGLCFFDFDLHLLTQFLGGVHAVSVHFGL